MNATEAPLLTQLATAYLSAYILLVQITLGAFGVICIHNLTGGRWGDLIRPFLERVSSGLPVIGVLALPLLLLMRAIYPWANFSLAFDAPHFDNIIKDRLGMMNPAFFTIRTLIYFAVWFFVLNKVKYAKSESKLKLWSGLSLMALLYTVSFAAFDWVMTSAPIWASTGFGALFLAFSLSAIFSVTLIGAGIDLPGVNHSDKPLRFDLGNLVLMSIMLWAYLNFMQYLVIWSGQIPREMDWYEARSSHGWPIVVTTIFVLHFAFPFCCLLFRDIKRRNLGMVLIGASVLIGQFLENIALIQPNTHQAPILSILFTFVALALQGVPWAWWLTRQGPPTVTWSGGPKRAPSIGKVSHA